MKAGGDAVRNERFAWRMGIDWWDEDGEAGEVDVSAVGECVCEDGRDNRRGSKQYCVVAAG